MNCRIYSLLRFCFSRRPSSLMNINAKYLNPNYFNSSSPLRSMRTTSIMLWQLNKGNHSLGAHTRTHYNSHYGTIFDVLMEHVQQGQLVSEQLARFHSKLISIRAHHPKLIIQNIQPNAIVSALMCRFPSKSNSKRWALRENINIIVVDPGICSETKHLRDNYSM